MNTEPIAKSCLINYLEASELAALCNVTLVKEMSKSWDPEIAKQAEQIRAEPPPLPGRGPYRVIVADLP